MQNDAYRLKRTPKNAVKHTYSTSPNFENCKKKYQNPNISGKTIRRFMLFYRKPSMLVQFLNQLWKFGLAQCIYLYVHFTTYTDANKQSNKQN